MKTLRNIPATVAGLSIATIIVTSPLAKAACAGSISAAVALAGTAAVSAALSVGFLAWHHRRATPAVKAAC